jgi:hypothetical protein
MKRIRLLCVVFSQNGTVFHLKKFTNYLINLKIIKIIIIKNIKYKNLKKLKGWPATPLLTKGWLPWPIWTVDASSPVCSHKNYASGRFNCYCEPNLE